MAEIDAQMQCLQEAIYHEARGESFAGQLYVGFVIRNRVENDWHPDDFCDVIKQPWQFSYNHVLNSLEMTDTDAAMLASDVAYMVIHTDPSPLPPYVLYYHATDVKPKWDYTKIEEYAIVGNHIFYEEL
jgi:spore germination cell wall hydrolase CwlJ-like protein